MDRTLKVSSEQCVWLWNRIILFIHQFAHIFGTHISVQRCQDYLFLWKGVQNISAPLWPMFYVHNMAIFIHIIHDCFFPLPILYIIPLYLTRSEDPQNWNFKRLTTNTEFSTINLCFCRCIGKFPIMSMRSSPEAF